MSRITPNAPDWLIARPIAHRGLHNKSNGIIENSISAAQAAVLHGFAIECDVQLSSDGEVFVFHDDTLDRVTAQSGRVDQTTAQDLGAAILRGSKDTIPTLTRFLNELNGQVPLICEIKSKFDGNTQIAACVHDVTLNYSGPLAFKSFDPAMVKALRELHCPRPLGFIGESTYDDPEWAFLGAQQKRDLISFTHYAETQPDFLSWWVRDLPNAATNLYRHALSLPVMTWTVRTPAQRETANQYASQMVFEGFVP